MNVEVGTEIKRKYGGEWIIKIRTIQGGSLILCSPNGSSPVLIVSGFHWLSPSLPCQPSTRQLSQWLTWKEWFFLTHLHFCLYCKGQICWLVFSDIGLWKTIATLAFRIHHLSTDIICWSFWSVRFTSGDQIILFLSWLPLLWSFQRSQSLCR